MWYDQLPPKTSWTSIWSGQILCARCFGIRRLETACPSCGDGIPSFEPRVVQLEDGQKFEVTAAFMGPEGRYEDYVYIQMIEREWKRPLNEEDPLTQIPPQKQPSPRAAIVLLFWTYFETRIERLLRGGMRELPGRLAEDTLKRYGFVGARINRLYKILFDTTYFADLIKAGYSDVASHLADVQRQRNAFSHGTPNAIDDELVKSVVEHLKREHEAWVTVFNKRATRPK